jgi:uncharacterized iron-regulated membrane protein
MTGWRRWVEHPEKSRLRNMLFQIHLIVGAIGSAYIALMSLSGSVVVWQAELYKVVPIEWLVKAHDNLLAGPTGRLINGIGGASLVSLCLTGAVIWWPGIKNWRRSLTVKWQAHLGRISWDLHSALGFWLFPFVLVWGLSAIYFGFPELVDPLFRIDRADRYTDAAFYQLSQLHFGRFGWLSEVVWSIVGLAPAALAFTGVFICCRRMIYKKPSNPNHDTSSRA